MLLLRILCFSFGLSALVFEICHRRAHFWRLPSLQVGPDSLPAVLLLGAASVVSLWFPLRHWFLIPPASQGLTLLRPVLTARQSQRTTPPRTRATRVNPSIAYYERKLVRGLVSFLLSLCLAHALRL